MAKLYGQIVMTDDHKHKAKIQLDKAHKFATEFIDEVRKAYADDKMVHADFHQHDSDEILLTVQVHNSRRSFLSFGMMKVPVSHYICAYIVKLKPDFTLKDKTVECLIPADDLPFGVDEANKHLASKLKIHIRGH